MSFRRFVTCACLTVLAGSWDTVLTARLEARQAPAPATADQAAPESPKPKPLATFVNGRLSVQAKNRSLSSVFEDVSNAIGIPLVQGEGMADQMVSVEFKDLPLDQGLQLMLKTLDAFYFYGGEGTGPAKLKGVWVYPKGKASRMLQALSGTGTDPGTAELEQDLNDSDPAVRARAAEALIKRQGKRALETLLQVAGDPDERVRFRALNQAVLSGVAVPDYLSQQMALADPSPTVRFLALTALANATGADPARTRQVAELALKDANEIVRQQAREMLVEQDERDRSSGGVPREEPQEQQPQPRQ